MHTQGSETSQYLEEKIPNSISLVAASEREGAQTREPRFCAHSSSLFIIFYSSNSLNKYTKNKKCV